MNHALFHRTAILQLQGLFLVLWLGASLLHAQFNEVSGQRLDAVIIEDKCGYDEKLALEMKELLGNNWGYGYDSLLVDLSRWAQSPYVTVDSLGASVQNRAIWQLTITSNQPPGPIPRRTVFIHARTHPSEVQGFWATNEMIQFLLTEASLAKSLREAFVFYIIPMYNPDGVELGYFRENANMVDLESNWDANPVEPEVAVLRNRFSELMASNAPIEVALNMHASFRCRRYFVYHDAAGTSVQFTLLEQSFINGVRFYFPGGIEPWNYFVSWTSGTPPYYPESWFWMNFAESVMALTYEDMNCTAAGSYDSTALALLQGIADYLSVPTSLLPAAARRDNEQVVLQQNFPNPISATESRTASTVIQYVLNKPLFIRLSLYDVLGRQIAVLDAGYRSAGVHSVPVKVAGLSNGYYFYRLETPENVKVRRLLVIK